MRYLIILLLFASCSVEKPVEEDKTTKIAFIADVQYCDCETNGTREYRNSLNKLKIAVEDINQEDADYVVQLGDLIDRDLSSFDSVLPVMDDFDAPVINVLGNHDFEVENKNGVPYILGLNKRYYLKETENLNIAVLDGQEISLFAYDNENHPNVIKAKTYLESINYSKKEWNGAMSQEQLKWLENILKTSDKPVLIVSHYPIFPLGGQHNLWNDEELYNLIENNKGKVVGYFNGHNHLENIQGIYHTLDGMVEKEGKSYYIFEF